MIKWSSLDLVNETQLTGEQSAASRRCSSGMAYADDNRRRSAPACPRCRSASRAAGQDWGLDRGGRRSCSYAGLGGRVLGPFGHGMRLSGPGTVRLAPDHVSGLLCVLSVTVGKVSFNRIPLMGISLGLHGGVDIRATIRVIGGALCPRMSRKC